MDAIEVTLRSKLFGKTKQFTAQPNTTIEDIKQQLIDGTTESAWQTKI